MSAKKIDVDHAEPSDPYLESSKDPDLEKKIDEMMSVEEPIAAEKVVPPKQEKKSKSIAVFHDDPEPPQQESAPELKASEKVVTPITITHHEDGPTDTLAGAPLLPTDKLPDLDKPKPEPEDEPEVEPEHSVEELEASLEEPIEPVEAFENTLTDTEEPVITPDMSIEEAEKVRDELGLEDANTNKAVDDIIASEADELLAAHDRDSGSLREERPLVVKTPKKRRVPKALVTFIVLGILAAVGVAGAVPTSRYFVLNTAGVRVASSIKVIDETTSQPLKNAEFIIGGQSAKTDAEGNARVEKLKLGKTDVTIKKPAFADINQSVTLGWGSNPLGEFRIKGVGSKYTFVVTDFISKKPITGADAVSGEANAQANDKGEIVLTISQSEEANLEVKINAPGYRTEVIDASKITKESQAIQLVPSRKHAFISKRAGTFDLYKIDVDGKNEEKVLAGTGKERSDTMALSTHPTKNIAALVSTREGSPAGKASLGTLTLVNLDDNKTTNVTQSERIQLIDWVGNKLIYVKIGDNETEDSQKRHRLISYDIDSKSERELASTNYFNDVSVVNGSIYYSPAMYQVNGTVGLYKVNAEGNVRKTVYDKEVWTMLRTAYDKLSVSMGQDWYELNVATDVMTKSSAPSVLKTRGYLDDPVGSVSLWIDERDGKGALISYDKQSKVDKVIQTQAGLKSPVEWLDAEHVIYRVSTNQEIADYIFSPTGGDPRKIKDVTDTAGIDRWYYY